MQLSDWDRSARFDPTLVKCGAVEVETQCVKVVGHAT
jgi:hypothetical protein